MKNLLLTIKYDGSNYHGWQVQNNAVTVQEVLQDAIEKVFSKRLGVVGCSRTDSGVHANMYCVSFKTDMNITDRGVVLALNTHLPSDIAVVDCKQVSPDFHPRYNCVTKEYIYKIYNAEIRNPFYTDYAYHYKYNIDAEYLNKEAKAFIGTYDFSAFCSAKSDVEDTVRTVKAFDVWREGDMVFFKVEANGFLYNMVRIMVGTLLQCASGKIGEGEIKSIILSKNRKKAGKTAPPQGLYLNKINY